MTARTTDAKKADTATPIHPLLAQRWSPRGFDQNYVLDDDTLTALLEAARWAPSANNSQPWRFLVTRRGEVSFDRVTEILAPGNRSWAPAASALVLVAAQFTDEAGRPRPWALYDTGQAVAALTVQAGFDGIGAPARRLRHGRCSARLRSRRHAHPCGGGRGRPARPRRAAARATGHPRARPALPRPAGDAAAHRFAQRSTRSLTRTATMDVAAGSSPNLSATAHRMRRT